MGHYYDEPEQRKELRREGGLPLDASKHRFTELTGSKSDHAHNDAPIRNLYSDTQTRLSEIENHLQSIRRQLFTGNAPEPTRADDSKVTPGAYFSTDTVLGRYEQCMFELNRRVKEIAELAESLNSLSTTATLRLAP